MFDIKITRQEDGTIKKYKVFNTGEYVYFTNMNIFKTGQMIHHKYLVAEILGNFIIHRNTTPIMINDDEYTKAYSSLQFPPMISISNEEYKTLESLYYFQNTEEDITESEKQIYGDLETAKTLYKSLTSKKYQ